MTKARSYLISFIFISFENNRIDKLREETNGFLVFTNIIDLYVITYKLAF